MSPIAIIIVAVIISLSLRPKTAQELQDEKHLKTLNEYAEFLKGK